MADSKAKQIATLPIDEEEKLAKSLEGYDLSGIELAYDEGIRGIKTQIDVLGGLDTKAGILIGFAGVILSTLITTLSEFRSARSEIQVMLGLAVFSIVLAGLTGIRAFWTYRYLVVVRVPMLASDYDG